MRVATPLAATAARTSSVPQPSAAGQHQPQVGMIGGQAGEGLHQGGDGLAGLDRAHEGEIGRPYPERVEHRQVGGVAGRGGPEAVVVDAVGDGEDGGGRFERAP